MRSNIFDRSVERASNRLPKNAHVLTMASNLSRRKIPYRSLEYDGRSIHDKISRDPNDRNRRKHYETGKRNKSDNYRYNNKRKEITEENYKSKRTKKYRKDDKIQRGDREKPESNQPWPESLIEEIKKMLTIEDHHVISFEDTANVEWCPKFVKPEIRGRVTGGKALLHHTCRHCRRLCLHLLGRPGTGRRLCLGCHGSAEWEKKLIPEWYYHNSCKYCGQK